MRIHIIHMPDLDRHLHDHPWRARTWILMGGYDELRREEYVYDDGVYDGGVIGHPLPGEAYDANWDHIGVVYERRPGDTSTLGFDEYHKILSVEPGGAVTLFAFGRWQGDWGFVVEGNKVPYREYEKRFKVDHG